MNRSLREAADEVERRIAYACARSGRRREEVNVIAVTKYVSLERTIEAIEAGYPNVGENRWQDAKEKWEALQGRPDVVWHFIGHLQTNKVKDVLGRFSTVHSLDRWSLAEELQKKAKRLGIVVPCFVQLNVSGEQTKYGLAPGELRSFLSKLTACDAIDVVGLMTMAPHEEDPERTRPVFKALRELRDEANAKGSYGKPIEHLSMGMSNDFEIAVEEGATWIRLGSTLVGK
ncbi:YggS family pyridoxal phosphate-dependent enzyme [Paenibacillus antri]|uniref:Pyridoxal phosphate homeostasis protein n=1 Tax=Paenibacillus antri TaxID=2582848 RepID=A0A5R9GCM1_9BACL|nr:YggS family pyridoxal phosphate-dependent enzyme [Paenibacillus antri]TLS50413.1 YggS family pyridoxal phosphate-dependent enzyme [Paenibacillus antri]